VQHDEEILGVHQRADDVVDAAQHVRHVAIGARELRNREQRVLQTLRTLQALERSLQLGRFQRPAQMTPGDLQLRRHGVKQTLAIGPPIECQQQHSRVRLEQADRQPVAVRVQHGRSLAGDRSRQGQLRLAQWR
jgi:hypothetical protein